MNRMFYVLVLIAPVTVCAQNLQNITDTGNSTTNLLQLTGAGKVPTTSKGLELYGLGNDNEGVIQAYDRNAALPMKLVLQPNTGSVTSIHQSGGRLLINGAADDASTALAVNGRAAFSLFTGGAKRGVFIFNDNYGGGRSVFAMDANDGNAAGLDYFLMEHYAGATGAKLSTANAAPLTFATNDTDRMTIAANGNVGIGLSLPSEKLTVNGTVWATKVKVNQSVWPDFVFHSTYRLPGLHELERFILQNGHLPGIPTATEVTRNGIDVGDSQAKLLQKVEELTLYLIDLNKKLELQQGEIKALRSQLARATSLPLPRKPAK